MLIVAILVITYYKDNNAMKSLGFMVVGGELIVLVLSYIPVEIALRKMN